MSNRTGRKRLSAGERREVIELAATEVFAERGYDGASMDEIARRSGISAPVLYDHFESKRELHRALLERHYADLREVWRKNLPGDEAADVRIARSIDAWFAYVESHHYAWRMLFADTTGDPEVEAVRRQVAGESRAAIRPMLADEPGSENIAGADLESIDMSWEVLRAVLQGLALWWYEHQHVPREKIVQTAMNAIWIGFERVSRGETWTGDR
ncbi:MAG TPA: TetR/AcrR family transcriptional regulator [Candidatus Dormibacteraeota bacterium]|nr:TetR/AcrR family transcriptional regulator [Candidatus Dormibacteraeota bacterium]